LSESNHPGSQIVILRDWNVTSQRFGSFKSDRLQDDDGKAPAIARRFLTCKELALATTLSEQTLRRLFKRRLVVGYQPGGPRTRIVFPVDAIEQAIQAAAGPMSATAESPSEPSSDPKRGPRPKWLDTS
jgi:hypothetical protein